MTKDEIVLVTDGQQCVGYIIAFADQGVEAFDVYGDLVGTYATRRRAALELVGRSGVWSTWDH